MCFCPPKLSTYINITKCENDGEIEETCMHDSSFSF